MSLKTVARLLNFILFLILVSAGLSHGSHAASLPGADTLPVVTKTERDVAATVNDLNSTPKNPSHSSNTNDLIPADHPTGALLNSSPDDKPTVDSTQSDSVQKAGATSTSPVVAETDSAKQPAPLVTNINPPDSSNPSTKQPLNQHSSYMSSRAVSQPAASTHVSAPPSPAQPPTTPTNSHDTGILNASTNLSSANITKSFLDRLNSVFATTVSYNHTSTSLPIANLISTMFVIAMLLVWATKGFGSVVVPRGQTPVLHLLSQSTKERYGLCHSALFREFNFMRLAM